MELKTNITQNLFAKASIGYANTYEEISYDVKTYKYVIIEGVEGYQPYNYSVNKIEYSIFPLNIGVEYKFMKGKISPFALLEAGYNIISAESHLSYSGSGMPIYTDVEDIPAEYKTDPPVVTEGAYPVFSIGAGLSYTITPALELSVRYIFRYNDSIVNSNHIIIGVAF